MTVFEADIAVNDEWVSERVCLLLEKSRSTDILTPGMARMSLAILEQYGLRLGSLQSPLRQLVTQLTMPTA